MFDLLIVSCAEFVNAQVKLIKMDQGRRKYLVYLPKTYQESPSKNLQKVELLLELYRSKVKKYIEGKCSELACVRLVTQLEFTYNSALAKT